MELEILKGGIETHLILVRRIQYRSINAGWKGRNCKMYVSQEVGNEEIQLIRLYLATE